MADGGFTDDMKMHSIDFLKEDFAQTVAFIDKCDNHIFQIKNWAILTSSAVIAFSVSQDHNAFALANPLLLLPFLYLELIYKSFQDTAIEHTDDLSRRIDKYLADPNVSDLLSEYNHSFGRKLRYPDVGRLIAVFRNPNRWHIRNFYGLLALISILAFLVGKFFV